VPLTELVRVAGSRCRVEETFQTGKGLAGLDEHQVRRYPSWTRWVTLAMLADAFLAVDRADDHARNPALNGLADWEMTTCSKQSAEVRSIKVVCRSRLAARGIWPIANPGVSMDHIAIFHINVL
jgi:hypothetical protein